MAMAAEKPQLSSLKTPVSATYPSELRSPMLGTPAHLIKQEKTPVSPPVAYTDFLKNLSPVLLSPLSTGASLRFNVEKSAEPTATPTSAVSAQPSTAAPTSSNTTPTGRPSSHPPLSRTGSTDSNASTSTCASCESRKSSISGVSIPPPSPYNHSASGSSSARTPRRLHIPQSPSVRAVQSPASARSPMSAPVSARSLYSTSSPLSASCDVDGRTTVSAPPSGGSTTVTLKQVVKRTVVTTYSTTPLDPAPKGKRRKTDES